MGAPNKQPSGLMESLDRMLHRLVEMVDGEHDHEPAQTVEGSVRRIESELSPPSDDKAA